MATKYFTGNSSVNWSDAGNWSFTSGGGAGAGVPTGADDVILDASTVSSCDLDINADCLSITTIGFANTLNLFNSLTSNGNVLFSLGTLFGSSGSLYAVGGSTLTNNTGTNFPGSLILSGTVETWTLASSWIINGDIINSTTTTTINTGSIQCEGSITINGACNGTTQFIMMGTGVLSTGISSSVTNIITINTSGTIIIGPLFQFGELDYTSGTVIWGVSNDVSYTFCN